MQSIDDHEILEALHESANSLVFRARRLADGQSVILKLLKKDYPTPGELTRYRQEYEITRSLESRHVILAHELRKHENTLLMTLEDFGGESVAKIMQRRRLTGAEILSIARQVTQALQEVHGQHVVHKDINPSNIVFNAETSLLKLIDFGISTRLSRENPVMRSPEVLEGTLAYMSPEQTGRTSRSMDYRTDFYSLGATLYQMVTNRLPFDTDDSVELVHCHIAKEVLPAHEVDARVSPVLSAIIGKLLAKAAEDRYQSTWGILADLDTYERTIAGEAEAEFVPGRADQSERFTVPQRLYGRESEVAAVLSTFSRVSEGSRELLLIAGYSGVGKSALIRKVYEPITAKRGYVAAGKFDQLQRNVPFSAIVRALQDLVRQLLTESEQRLEDWRQRLRAAFGANGQVIVDVIPDVELIVGPQPPASELGAMEANARFNLLFSSFIRVFCGDGRPLVLFLDDLQWADSASLNLLQLVMTDRETENLLVIGAYRNNEIDALHPLASLPEQLREQGQTVEEIELSPLGHAHLRTLIADTLRRPEDEVEKLTQLVQHKTQGNPFFVGQFLETLYDQGLVTRGAPSGEGAFGWEWDLDRIEAAGITDNVVELMIEKVRRLPEATQQALRVAACIGNRFDLQTLALTHGGDPAQAYKDLAPALEEGLVVPMSSLEPSNPDEVMSPLLIRRYRFLHDRVQQSAYALFAGGEEQSLHVEIGRRLLATTSEGRVGERVFEIVDHLNMGTALLSDAAERQRLAALNLMAGKRAKEATAYAASYEYLQAGLQLLPEDPWNVQYSVAVDLHTALSEIEYLNGNFERSEELVTLVLDNVRTDLERAKVHAMLIVQYTMRTHFEKAIESGRTPLALVGVDLPLDDLQGAAPAMLGEVAQRLGDTPVAELFDWPDAADANVQMAQFSLRHLTITAFLANQALFPVVTAMSVNLTLEHGNAPESALSYANYGLILGAFMGMYERGAEFGELGLRLCEKFHPRAPTATVCLVVGSELFPWVRHVSESLPVLQRGYVAGLEAGDILWNGFLVMYRVSHENFMGKNIETQLTELPDSLGFARRTKNQGALNSMLAHLLVLTNLGGITEDRTVFAADGLSEAEFLESCTTHKSAMALCFFNIFKAQALYLYGDYAEALELTRSVEDTLNYIVNHVQLAEHKLYQSLCLVQLLPTFSEEEQVEARTQLDANIEQLGRWAKCAPANYEHKYKLVLAEKARLDGDESAVDLYDQAIDGARDNEFVQDRALASELAARYWIGRGRKRRIAQMYLRDARYAYELWGANHKIAQLEEQFPELLGSSMGSATDEPTATTTATTTSTTTTRMSGTDRIDLASVLKASQAISGEIALADLLRKLIRIVIENAGAQRGVIVLENEGAWRIEASAAVDDQEVVVQQAQPLPESTELCVPLVQYVINSKNTVVLHDATKQGRFTTEPYVVRVRPRSVLCMPIVVQGRVSAVLYLENNLSEGSFTADRLGVLRVLASQAAISIDNASLYASLEAYNQTLEQKVEERTRDILRTRDQLIAQEKMAWMGTLSVGIAHEIKNPLNFINNFAEVSTELLTELKDELSPADGHTPSAEEVEAAGEIFGDIKSNLGKILQHGHRADGIVESMKLLAEGSADEIAEVDINQQVNELSNVVHHGRVAKGGGGNKVRLDKDFAEGLGMQSVVPQGLGRALVNVLNNAYDAVEDKRRTKPDEEAVVTVSTVDDGDHYEIRVRDSGGGIALEHLDQIRDPFFTTKPAGSGHIGLGLSVSNDIIALRHHGRLDVETEPGRYAEFRIRLPKDLGASPR